MDIKERCEVCGSWKHDVRCIPDPYMQEAYDQNVMMNLCADCEQMRYYAI
jgi:hypothetical protein